MVLYIRPMASRIFIGGLFTLTFVLSGIVYPSSVGSVWCFVSAVLAPLIVLLNYLILQHKN